MRFESLERRNLLAVALVSPGTPGDDLFVIDHVAGVTTITRNGSSSSFADGELISISVVQWVLAVYYFRSLKCYRKTTSPDSGNDKGSIQRE